MNQNIVYKNGDGVMSKKDPRIEREIGGLRDLRNSQFERWLVLDYVAYEKRGKTKHPLHWWKCQCDCSNKTIKEINERTLIANTSKSCGCLSKEINRENRLSHGLAGTIEYYTWAAMKSRCYQDNHPAYHNYGGRGITVCGRWFDSFENFYEDMGNRPSKIHSIDRIDVNGDYCPENCRWGTLEEQNNNKTNNKYLEYDGEKLTIPQWSRKLGISRHVIYSRISAGWTTERIILQPVQKQSHR